MTLVKWSMIGNKKVRNNCQGGIIEKGAKHKHALCHKSLKTDKASKRTSLGEL